MSISSEEYLISHEENSEKTSSLEDSLTAKLDNMLYSSDEVNVRNVDFFKASSNEMTEIDEVDNLPQSSNQSVPKLELEEQKRSSNINVEYKSCESYTSLGTVVRHETPKIGQRKIKPVQNLRPQSVNRRRSYSKPKENTNPKELIYCLKKIANKHPGYLKIIKNETHDFKNYFFAKVSQFRELIRENENVMGI